ncbi:MAG: putative Ig domain-containing protein [Verrucomicrobiota bacterium]
MKNGKLENKQAGWSVLRFLIIVLGLFGTANANGLDSRLVGTWIQRDVFTGNPTSPADYIEQQQYLADGTAIRSTEITPSNTHDDYGVALTLPASTLQETYTRSVSNYSGGVLSDTPISPPFIYTRDYVVSTDGNAFWFTESQDWYVKKGVSNLPQTIDFNLPDRVLDIADPFSTFVNIPIVSSNGLPLTYEVISGPAQVFQALNNSCGLILVGAGATLPSAGTVTLRASQSGNSIYLPVTKTFTFQVILKTSLPVPTLKSANIASGNAGQSFSYTSNFGAGASNYAASGLPGGLRINPATGVISGTPTVDGTFVVTLSALNSGGTGSATLTITIAPIPQNQTITFTIPDKTYPCPDFLLTATVPSGLPITYSVVSGAALVRGGSLALTGTGAVTVRASQAGNITYAPAQKDATFNVGVTVLPNLITSITASGTTGKSFAYSPGYDVQPLSISVAGLPPGLAYDSSTKTITGTPSVAGVFVVTLTAANALGSSPATVTFTIAQNAQIISSSSTGVPGNSGGQDPNFGAGSYGGSEILNSRYFAISSNADNLDSSGKGQGSTLLVKDLQTGTIQRPLVTITGGSLQSGVFNVRHFWDPGAIAGQIKQGSFAAVSDQLPASSWDACISPNGRYLAFSTDADNLVPFCYSVLPNPDGIAELVSGDINSGSDVYLKDLVTGSYQLISSYSTGINSRFGGSVANGYSQHPKFSPDGKSILFESSDLFLEGQKSNHFTFIYLKNLLTGDLQLVSCDSAGVVANYECTDARFSGDGRAILFTSIYADNLAQGTRSNTPYLYLKDLQTGVVQAVTTTSTGVIASFPYGLNGFCGSISDDRRYVCFLSNSTNLGPVVPLNSRVPIENGGYLQVFLKDMQTGTITNVSTNAAGIPADGDNDVAEISPDGRYVAFSSFALNLSDEPVPPSAFGPIAAGLQGQYLSSRHVYVKELHSGAIKRLATFAGNPKFSRDGTFLVLSSNANIEGTETNGISNVYKVPNPFITPGISVAPPVLTPQTISFTAPQDCLSNAAPIVLTATALPSLLPVTFTVVSGPARISGNTLTLTGVGPVTLRANQAGNSTYAEAVAEVTFNVGAVAVAQRSAQVITFTIGDKTYPSPAFGLAATVPSGLPISFEVLSGPATLSGGSLVLSGSGSVTVRATQSGNALYSPATKDVSFKVKRMPVPVLTSAGTASGTVGNPFVYTVAFDANGAGFTTSALPPGLSFTSITGIISGTPTTSGSFTVSLGATNSAGAGTGNLVVSIDAAPAVGEFQKVSVILPTSFVKSGNYNPRPNDAVVAGSLLYVAYGYEAFPYKARAALEVYNIANPNTPVLVKELIFDANNGIDRSFSRLILDGNYLYAVGVGLTVFDLTLPENPTVVAFFNKVTVPGGVDLNLHSQKFYKIGKYFILYNGWTGKMAVDFSDMSKQPIFVSNQETMGSGFIGAVIPDPDTVIIFDGYAQAYRDSFHAGQMVNTKNGYKLEGDLYDVAYAPLLRTAFVAAQRRKVLASNIDTHTYTSLDISSVVDYPDRIQYADGLAIVGNNAGFVTVHAEDPQAMSIGTYYPGKSPFGVGECFRSLPENNLLAVADEKNTVVLYQRGAALSTPIAPLITNQPVGGSVNIGGSISLNVSVSGTGPFTYEWSKDSVVIARGNASSYLRENVASSDSGKYFVTVSNSVGSVTSGTVDVSVTATTPSSQVIAFTIPDQTFPGSVALNASVPSGLPISYTVVSGSASVSGGSLILTGIGSVTVRATQPGNTAYAAATKDVTFNVTKLLQSQQINFSKPADCITTSPSFTLSSSPTSGLPVTYTLVSGPARLSGNLVMLTGATGIVTIIARQAGDSSYAAALPVTQSFTVTAMTTEPTALVITSQPYSVTAVTGATASLRVLASGAGPLSYRWKKETTDILNAVNSVYSIPNVATSDAGEYSVDITNSVGSVTSVSVQLTVSPLSPAIVGGSFSVVACEPNTTLKYNATNLPPGLVFDPATGMITGTPKKGGTYLVTITSTDSTVSAITFNIEVAELSPHIIGTYHGWIERSSALNRNLGSSIQLTTTATGAFSGKILTGTTSVPVKGVMVADPSLPTQSRITLPLSTGVVTLDVTLDGDTDTLSGGLSDTDGNSAALRGWRHGWAQVIGNAAQFKGLHTFYLNQPDTTDSLPQGYGHGSFAVSAKTGTTIVAGALADGSKFTSSTFVGLKGELLLYTSLYINRGSICGQLTIDPADNSISGVASWFRPDLTSSGRDLTYIRGFGPLDLEAYGGFYQAPARGDLVMGAVAGFENCMLSLSNGGLDSTLNQAVTISNPGTGTTNRASVSLNDNRIVLSSVSATTGAFSGYFTPTISAASGSAGRKTPFYGQIVNTNGAYTGYGYFLLPQADSTLWGGKVAPKLSGQVLFSSQ